MVVQLIQNLVWILLSGESMDPLKPFEWIWMVVQLATNTFQMVSPCVYKTNGHFWKWKFWMVTNGLSVWFDLSKPFKICLLAKWLSICLNLLKHSIIFCYCTTTPFNTLWKDLKGRTIGLWYIPMIKMCLFRELFHLSKPFIHVSPFCQTVF